jgi:hypothetical protein
MAVYPDPESPDIGATDSGDPKKVLDVGSEGCVTFGKQNIGCHLEFEDRA